MKIKGTVVKRRVAQKSKSPRTELRIDYHDETLSLRAAKQTDVRKVDRSLEALVNKKVELDGRRIEGTKVFVVNKFTILDDEKDK